MINAINRLIRTRFFQWVRIVQFVAALCIFSYAALMPAQYVGALNQPAWSLHFLGNMLLFLSASVACYGRVKIAALVVLLLPYSILIELAQRFMPGRFFDTQDLLFNFLGLITGFLVASLLELLWHRIDRANRPKVS